MVDRKIHLARALLVEGNALLRSVTASQLRDAGVGNVTQAGRAAEARLLLEREQFDIVVCCREFEEGHQSGQDLLDELRREQLLSPSTVFIMVAGSATYHEVVEAAEAALDVFLVRPYTAEMLGQRLAEARARKRELAEVLRALEAGETELALVRAIKRFQERAPYWSWCGRLAAELMLKLQRPADAKKIFERLAEAQRSPWARIGVARAEMAGGETNAARRRVTEVLRDYPDCADAHDLMGRLHVEHCDFDAALEEYRQAVQLTPGCMLRQQHTGALAFYQGRADEALVHLEQAVHLGVKSKLFDALTLLMIALLRFDRGDAAGVAAAREQLRRYHERFPGSHRLLRLQHCADALYAASRNDALAAATALTRLTEQALDDDFDLEAATTTLALLGRLGNATANVPEVGTLIDRMGMRFAGSRAVCEAMVAAAGRAEPAATVLRRCHTRVSALAEDAMGRALSGDPGSAVLTLLDEGERLRNPRLLDLGRSLAHRHRESVGDAAALAERADELLRRFGSTVNHIAGIQRSGRSPGALPLRGALAA
jgi:tetratricopeptide (TPR) repeat protein